MILHDPFNFITSTNINKFREFTSSRQKFRITAGPGPNLRIVGLFGSCRTLFCRVMFGCSLRSAEHGWTHDKAVHGIHVIPLISFDDIILKMFR